MRDFWFTKNRSSKKMSLWMYFFVPVFVAFFVGLSHSQDWFSRFDNILYDNILSQSKREYSDDIVVVAIDQASLDAYGRWPWSRGYHAQLTEKLSQARAVVFDILFPERNAADLSGDEDFADAIANHGRVILPVHLEIIRNKGQLLEIPPAEIFYSAANTVGHVHAYCENDSICRSVFLFEGLGSPYWAHIAFEADRIESPKNDYGSNSQASTDKVLSGFKREALNHYYDTQWREQRSVSDAFIVLSAYQAFIPFNTTKKPYAEVSYVDVINGKVPPEFFANKTVFVGAISAGLGDTLSTPSGLKPGVVMNAIIYEAFRDDTLIVKKSDRYITLIVMFLTLLFTYVLGRLGPASFLIALLLLLLTLYFFQYWLITSRSVWISISPLMLGLIVFYPLWNWFKLHIALRFLKQAIFRINKYDENSKINHASYSRSLRGIFPDESTDLSLGLSQRYSGRIGEPLSWNKQKNITGEEIRTGVDVTLYSDHAEIVSRTISQLQNAMSIAEVNHTLIQQSLSNLQDAVVIVNHRRDVVLSNNVADDLFFLGDLKCIPDITNCFEGKSGASLSEKIDDVLDNNIEFSEEFEYLKTEHQGLSLGDQHILNGSPAGFTKHFLCVGKNISFPIVVAEEHTVDISILTFSDISKIKNVEQSRLDTLNFLSHDLRSPMVSVLALIEQHEIIEKQTSDNNVDGLLNSIRQYVQKNLSYSESILQLSRAEELSEDSFILVDLHSVLDSAYQQVLPIAIRSGISLVIRRAEDDLWVMGSYDLLERVIVNLLTNGIKFSEEDTSINIDVSIKNDKIDILVKDEGRGIIANELPTVFDRYARGHNKKIKTGAGLGLFFVRTVLAKHNGEVSVTSEVGQGTCFHIVLPSINPNVQV